MKRCSACRKQKPLDDFHKHPHSSSGRQSRCKQCIKEYYEINRASCNATARHSKRLVKYGIKADQYEKMRQEQKDCCAICTELIFSPHIDHCHTTGKVRGLLCPSCNIGLGNFRDSIELLRAAIKYLKRT